MDTKTWIERFEEENGRKPSVEEYAQALENGQVEQPNKKEQTVESPQPEVTTEASQSQSASPAMPSLDPTFQTPYSKGKVNVVLLIVAIVSVVIPWARFLWGVFASLQYGGSLLQFIPFASIIYMGNYLGWETMSNLVPILLISDLLFWGRLVIMIVAIIFLVRQRKEILFPALNLVFVLLGYLYFIGYTQTFGDIFAFIYFLLAIAWLILAIRDKNADNSAVTPTTFETASFSAVPTVEKQEEASASQTEDDVVSEE